MKKIAVPDQLKIIAFLKKYNNEKNYYGALYQNINLTKYNVGDLIDFFINYSESLLKKPTSSLTLINRLIRCLISFLNFVEKVEKDEIDTVMLSKLKNLLKVYREYCEANHILEESEQANCINGLNVRIKELSPDDIEDSQEKYLEQILTLKRELEAIKKTLKDEEEVNKALKDKVSRQESTITNKTKSLEQLKAYIKKLEELLKSNQNKITSLEKELAENESSNEVLSAKLAELKKEHEDISTELNNLQKEHRELLNEHQELLTKNNPFKASSNIEAYVLEVLWKTPGITLKDLQSKLKRNRISVSYNELQDIIKKIGHMACIQEQKSIPPLYKITEPEVASKAK